MIRFENCDGIPIVDSFIRLYGDLISSFAPHFDKTIFFKSLSPRENRFRDIMGRVGQTVYISMEEVGKIGLTDPEILASLAHEIGHVVYSTRNWHIDCEQRADTLASDLGLGTQMITAIEKILESRRYERLTSMLVSRIHFLQNMSRGGTA